MTDTPPDPSNVPPRPGRRGKRPHPVLRWVAGVMIVLVVLPATAMALLYVAMHDRLVRLPDTLQARIEARIDGAMQANRIDIGDIGLALREGGVTPQIVLSDVQMFDGEALRAEFPRLSVDLDGSALLRGDLRPSRVALGGAGLRLSRDETGRIDLALSDAETAAARSLTETLARIDMMVAQPVFADLAEITGSGLEVLMEDAMTGQVIRVFDAGMRLVRKGDALTLTVGGSIDATRDTELSLAVTRSPGLGRTDMRLQFGNLAARDLATVAPALNWLDLMRAPISGALITRLEDDGSIGDLNGTLDIGAGAVTLGDRVAPLPFDAVSTYFDYDAEDMRLTFTTFNVTAPALSFQATGHADLSPDGTSYVGQFRFGSVLADPEGVFDAPVAFEGGALDMRLSLVPEVRVEIGQAVLFDGPLQLRAGGELVGRADGLHARIDAHLPAIDVDAVLPYWPAAAVPGTRRWLETNIAGGRLSDVTAAVRIAPGTEPVTALRLDFEEAQVQALRRMPPITGAAGYLSLENSHFALRLSEGEVTSPLGGAVGMGGSVMMIEDMRPRNPDAVFDLRAAGALQDVLALAELPPINLFARGNLSAATLGTGQARLQGDLRVPLRNGLRPGDVDFAVTGELRDLRSDSLVAGRMLAADVLELSVTPGAVEIAGRATLDGVPATARWSRAIGPDAPETSTVEGVAPLSAGTLAAFGVVLPPGMITGQAEARFDLSLGGGGPPVLTVASDMAGLGLALDALSWRLPEGGTGDLSATVRLGPSPAVTALDLVAGGLTLDASASLREEGGLDRLTAARLSVGDWIDVQGAVVGRGPGRLPRIEVTGGTVDLRRAPPRRDGAAGGGRPGPEISARLERLQISDGIALTGLVAEMTTTGGLSGPFQGLVNGAAPVSGTLVTTQNGPAVRLQTEDGGAMLRAAGLFQNAYGGALDLVLRPTPEQGSYDGQLTIDGPRLRNAPAMAELLNAISVVGLLEQLGDSGINLGMVEADFRLTPRAVTIEQGSAVGPSMGITMEGVYDLTNRQISMQGVLSPIYVVNGVLGAVFAPRREGLFGFTYRLTGTPEATSVSVNPLSILTPGIFREIFRSPAPEVSQ